MRITDKDKKGAADIELRSEQIREILGQVPKWVIRYGTLIIFLVLFFLIVGSSLLKYPDVITARIFLTTETPPAQLVSKTSAKIEHLFVGDKEIVADGQILAIFESAANYEHVLRLQELLGENYHIDTLRKQTFPDNLKLGPMQDSYATFQKRLQEYASFVKLDYYNRKISSIKLEVKKYSLFLERLKDQEGVLKRDFQLAEKQFMRDSSLFIDGVLSSAQLEKSETLKLSKLYEWKDNKTKLASSEIDVSKLQQEILEMELKLEENSRQHTQRLQEDFEKLKGQIAVWEEICIVKSPFEGQVSFTKIWGENQHVMTGEIVMTVLPIRQGDIIGKALIDAKGAGKVEENHHVVIRFDNYPFMEYGTVSGKISSISLVPVEEQYSVEISLDSSYLITNYGISLSFQQNMPGLAEIITEQRTLLQRLSDPFRAAINRQKSLNY